MNRKRLGQFLIGGVFAACAAVVAALIDLVAEEEARKKEASPHAPTDGTQRARAQGEG